MINVNMGKLDIKAFQKELLRAEKNMRYIISNTVNDTMFNFREYAYSKGFGDVFVVRNKSMFKKFTRVIKSKPGLSAHGKYVTLKGPRFSGMQEQQLGTKTWRKKVATPFARGGSKYGKRKIPQRFRTRPGNNRLRKPWEMGFSRSSTIKNNAHRTVAFLYMLERKKYTGPALILGHPKLPGGIYNVSPGKKPEAAQLYKFEKSQPKRKDWAGLIINSWHKHDSNLINRIVSEHLKKNEIFRKNKGYL